MLDTDSAIWIAKIIVASMSGALLVAGVVSFIWWFVDDDDFKRRFGFLGKYLPLPFIFFEAISVAHAINDMIKGESGAFWSLLLEFGKIAILVAVQIRLWRMGSVAKTLQPDRSKDLSG